MRLWLAFAAIGAALIHLAVGASAPLSLAITLVGFGIAELGWGIATLIRGRLLAPEISVFAAPIPVLVWGATATLGSVFGSSVEATALPLFPMAIASLFNVFLAVTLAVIRRRAANRSSTTDVAAADVAAAPQGWRFLTALMVGGILFSGLTTPALAATDAGRYAVPHGSHPEIVDDGHGSH